MDSFLKELAQARPDPGGGAAAAYGARLGLAILEKVVLLENRRRRQPEGEAALAWEETLTRLRRVAASFEKLQEEDVLAYFNLTAARSAGDPARLAAAVREAVDCPRRIMEQAGEALQLLAGTGEGCQKHLVSDLLVACEFLWAALKGAFHIAGANLPLVAEEASRWALAGELRQACQRGAVLYQQTRTVLGARENGVAHCGG